MNWIARQKFRFDLGAGFMTVLNFAFVVISASDKIGTALDIQWRWVVIAIVPTAVFGVWLLGWYLDRKKFWHKYQDEMNDRNALLNELRNRGSEGAGSESTRSGQG